MGLWVPPYLSQVQCQPRERSPLCELGTGDLLSLRVRANAGCKEEGAAADRQEQEFSGRIQEDTPLRGLWRDGLEMFGFRPCAGD